jgi:hypothetical protein
MKKEEIDSIYREVKDLINEILNPNVEREHNEVEKLFLNKMTPFQEKIFSEFNSKKEIVKEKSNETIILLNFFLFDQKITFDQIKKKALLFQILPPNRTEDKEEIILVPLLSEAEEKAISLLESHVRS